MIDRFEQGVVIELPDAASVEAALPVDAGDGLIVIELPTDVDDDALRLETERRVLELIRLS